jgi:glutathione S-transferase
MDGRGTSCSRRGGRYDETLHHAGFALRSDGQIVVVEKQLEGRVELVVAQTRSVDSPYYRIAPSGRVPYLVRDDGVGLEESSVICHYLDHLDGKPEFDLPTDEGVWEALRLGALATSLMDGLSVWLRETRRLQNEQSPEIIRHETDRAKRLIDLWETDSGADRIGLCAWARGAQSRFPMARGALETARVVRPLDCAPIDRRDGSPGGPLRKLPAQVFLARFPEATLRGPQSVYGEQRELKVQGEQRCSQPRLFLRPQRAARLAVLPAALGRAGDDLYPPPAAKDLHHEGSKSSLGGDRLSRRCRQRLPGPP